MNTPSDLTRKRCVSCEGEIEPLDPAVVAELIPQVAGWSVVLGGTAIRREWTARNFSTAVHFLDEVAGLAEAEGHHPDFHLTGYRQVAIELTTHAVGGLTENDFILAAKINTLPMETRSPKPPAP